MAIRVVASRNTVSLSERLSKIADSCEFNLQTMPPFHFARHPISCDSDGAVFQDFHVFIQCCHSRSFISKHGNKAGTVLIVALDLALLYLRIITGRSGQAIHSVRSRPSTLLGSSGSATNPIFCLDPKHPQSQPKLHYSLQSLQVSCRPRLRGSAGPKSSGS